MSSQQSLDSVALTPPPSTQVPPPNRGKTRTPTPPVSHISTPPPTVGPPGPSQNSRLGDFASGMSEEDMEKATPEDLRKKVTELQAEVQGAKMSAAHHQLQYQMLARSSAAEIERMSVEARMAQSENEVIHVADQARLAATPTPEQGFIPIHKDLYQHMCRDIQLLREANHKLEIEHRQQHNELNRQEHEIVRLTEKTALMAERIRANRESLHKYRRPHLSSRTEQTPRSVYGTPHRAGQASRSHQQSQPFAALLQASEMASQESARAGKKGHSRNTHSMSSLPATPQRTQGLGQVPPFQTPQTQRQALQVPATAPQQRTSAMRTPDVYSQPSLPVPQQEEDPQSDGTVSASDEEAHDSEAETDIIENDEIPESQASLTASQMLRTSQEDMEEKRESFKGRGMLDAGSNLRQTKLFGAIRKPNVNRGEDGPPAKKSRISPGIGLGISTVRE